MRRTLFVECPLTPRYLDLTVKRFRKRKAGLDLETKRQNDLILETIVFISNSENLLWFAEYESACKGMYILVRYTGNWDSPNVYSWIQGYHSRWAEWNWRDIEIQACDWRRCRQTGHIFMWPLTAMEIHEFVMGIKCVCICVIIWT
jgi:hypothetical protein